MLAKISEFTVANLPREKALLIVAIFKGMVQDALNGLLGICIRYKLCHIHVITHSGDKFERPFCHGRRHSLD